MNLNEALDGITRTRGSVGGNKITRPGGPTVRRASGHDEQLMGPYVMVTASGVYAFDASVADRTATDWAIAP
jgi:hypothetical protein